MPALVIFDLDKTLARSKQPIADDMASELTALLARTKVAVVSGGALPQFLTQVVARLPHEAPLQNLYLLPTSGGALYQYTHEWQKIYEEHIPEKDAAHITEIIRAACLETGLVSLEPDEHGERIEYRGAQVTLSALGQKAPVELKEAWDPSGEKKQTLRKIIAAKLPAYDVKTGGSTSIDITKHGINKAYGVRKLEAHLHIPIKEMLYVGDALYAGGNDEVVKESGIRTHQVTDPSDTLQFIRTLLRDS